MCGGGGGGIAGLRVILGMEGRGWSGDIRYKAIK